MAYLPLWTIYESQLGWWHSQYDGKNKTRSKPPTRWCLGLSENGVCTIQIAISMGNGVTNQGIGGFACICYIYIWENSSYIISYISIPWCFLLLKWSVGKKCKLFPDLIAGRLFCGEVSHTRWCPRSVAKLVQITLTTSTYGRYIELVAMGL